MPGYDAIIRFRCHKELVKRLAVLAEKLRRDEPDLYRIILEDYAEAEEKRLGLAPMTAEEEAHYLKVAENPIPYKVKQAPANQPQVKVPGTKQQKAHKN